VAAFVSGAVRRFGKLYGLVNSAGIRGVGNVLDTDPEVWRKVLSVNLEGTFNMRRRADLSQDHSRARRPAPRQWVKGPPGDLAPAGSNRSSHGGDEMAEAFG
jgi:NAD(P)-dependent dehydrogenase (short-subunit alcohol dehydrogenase family)